MRYDKTPEGLSQFISDFVIAIDTNADENMVNYFMRAEDITFIGTAHRELISSFEQGKEHDRLQQQELHEKFSQVITEVTEDLKMAVWDDNDWFAVRLQMIFFIEDKEVLTLIVRLSGMAFYEQGRWWNCYAHMSNPFMGQEEHELFPSVDKMEVIINNWLQQMEISQVKKQKLCDYLRQAQEVLQSSQ